MDYVREAKSLSTKTQLLKPDTLQSYQYFNLTIYNKIIINNFEYKYYYQYLYI